MPFDAPFSLGRFIVSAEGRLSPGDTDKAPGFALTWRNRHVHIQLESENHPAGSQDASRSGQLAVQVRLGRMPSTAGGTTLPRLESRTRLFTMVRGLPAHLPEAWTVELLPDHGLALAAVTEMSFPVSVSELLTNVTLFLLALGPYLDVLDEAGLDQTGLDQTGLDDRSAEKLDLAVASAAAGANSDAVNMDCANTRPA